MRDFTLIKANIRRQKGSFIGVFLLIWIISISLCAILSVWSNSNDYVNQQIDRLGYGTFTCWTEAVPDTDVLQKQIEELSDVEKVNVQPLIYVRYSVNGKESGSSALMLSYRQDEYYIFKDDLSGRNPSPKMPEQGEIYVTPAFCSLYDAVIGDKVKIISNDGTEYLTIRGFLEDPVMGSSMMGMKTILMNPDDWSNMEKYLKTASHEKNTDKETETANSVSMGAMFHIFQSEKSKLSTSEFQSTVLKTTALEEYGVWSYTKNAVLGFMLILQNIFSGFLIVFVLVLLVVTIIVLGHNISSNIEQDYVNMGILKAVGYTKRHLRMIQMGQHLLAVILGLLAGVPLSIPLVVLVNQLTVTATGLFMPTKLPVLYCVLVLAGIFLLLAAFICIKTTKIGKITPLRAIRNGAEDIYFKSRLTLPVYRSGINFWLAFRQFTSNKKQYISACLITSLLVFFLSLVGRLDAWIGPDGQGMITASSASPYDISLLSNKEGVVKDAEKLISEYTEIKDSYAFSMIRTMINGMDCSMNIISKPDYYNIVKGRTCKYDNELVLTEMIAKDLAVSIGDTVTVTNGDKEAEYIITGFNECANDMGINFSMNQDGFARIDATEGYVKKYTICYILTDADCVDKLSQKLSDTFGDSLHIDKNEWSGIDSIITAMSAIGILMYVIVILFILIVVFLTGGRILYREQNDLGIYKALGCHSGRLRLMFALRFVIVAALGSAIGIILNIAFTDPLVASIMKICGVSHFTSKVTLATTLLPGLAVSFIFFVFSYAAARKIKKIEPGILIIE